jgi:oligopeptide transport system permease protein
MTRFLIARLARVLAVLLGATIIIFLLMHAITGNPSSNHLTNKRMELGLVTDEAALNAVNRHFGLDLPLWRQFTRYLIGDLGDDGDFECGVICGNLGPSIQQRGRSVQDILFAAPEGKTPWESRFGYSLRLVLYSALIAAGLGVPLGIASATRRNRMLGRVISVGLAALISIPNFVLGLLAIVVLASGLKLIPVLPNWGRPSHWLIPAIVLAVMPMANIARVTAASLQNVLGEDYVRTARSKGLRQARVMLVHVMRNALAPLVIFLGPTLVELFTGLFIVENLYAFPGFGREYWYAVLALDYPVILAITLLYATATALVSVLVEVVAEIVDPRIRSVRQPGAA